MVALIEVYMVGSKPMHETAGPSGEGFADPREARHSDAVCRASVQAAFCAWNLNFVFTAARHHDIVDHADLARHQT